MYILFNHKWPGFVAGKVLENNCYQWLLWPRGQIKIYEIIENSQIRSLRKPYITFLKYTKLFILHIKIFT